MLNNSIILYSLICFTVFIAAYLIGSFPTGYVVVKLLANQDIRTVGSGSTGATNVKRVLGFKWFVIVLLTDAVKGILPVLAVKLISFPILGLLPVIAAVAVILGHSKPVFLKFHGGKSVATGVGTIIALNWVVGILVAVIWTVITYFSRYVSVGSIIAVWAAPCLMFIFDKPIPYIIYCAIGALYITILHKDNIVRLIHHEENKVR
ncbi:glycerol-3-phosphate 1-O-acyltransferase PlsY [bacterium]|nr:glycerol-3-phosphate 1-O-acyltransferase PlsY [bacterium]